jgi:molybdenum cofactor cytidylyltransferase
MGKIYTVILAAGSSSRLGFNKLLLKIDGETMIKRAITPFLSANIDRFFIVTGNDSDSLKKELEQSLAPRPSPLIFVPNQHYREGMSASVKAVLPFIEQADRVFFHLGDKPFVQQNMIHRMLAMLMDRNKNILLPQYRGMKGHPVLMNIKPYLQEMMLLEGDKGLREIIEKHLEDVLFIEGDEGSILDIDTIEDINQLKGKGYTIEEG